MIIEKITVKNFGGVCSYDALFLPGINVLKTRFVPELSAAIAFFLCSKASSAVPKSWVRKNTELAACVSLNGSTYTACGLPCRGQLILSVTDSSGRDVTDFYQYAMSHCPEQDAIESFDGRDKSLPSKLCRYRNPQDYPKLQTDQTAKTKTFRSHLIHYIRSFQPEPIRKNYLVTINSRGKFEVIHSRVPGKVFLSETEEKLFLYICFLNIAQFWKEIETIRDIHHEKKPLLVRNFLEYLDESVDVSDLMHRTQMLCRQVMILIQS